MDTEIKTLLAELEELTLDLAEAYEQKRDPQPAVEAIKAFFHLLVEYPFSVQYRLYQEYEKLEAKYEFFG